MKLAKAPKRIRPSFPKEWNVSSRPDMWLTWSRTERKLKRELVYWVTSVRADGRPHAAPLWGIWLDDSLFFETDPDSVKAQNIKRDPSVIVHTQDGYDTVIVEGLASIEDRPQVLKKLNKMYEAKYDYKPDWSIDSSQKVYRVDPTRVHAWKNPHMHANMVKFVFGP